MNYEQWDKLANAYIFIIGAMCVIYIFRSFFSTNFKTSSLQLLTTCLSLLFIYAIMLIDKNWQLWPTFDVQYSIKTALALVFVCYFVVHGRLSRWLAIVSMLGYIELMMYQNFYSWVDVITTAIVITPLLIFIQSQSSNILVPARSKHQVTRI